MDLGLRGISRATSLDKRNLRLVKFLKFSLHELRSERNATSINDTYPSALPVCPGSESDRSGRSDAFLRSRQPTPPREG